MKITQYNGMAVEEARAKAQAAGFEVKVELPGMQTLNCEYRQGRLTLKVENGVVVGAEIG